MTFLLGESGLKTLTSRVSSLHRPMGIRPERQIFGFVTDFRATRRTSGRRGEDLGMARRRERVPPRPRLDYHDPSAGIGGAPPAASALTLRLWLAAAALLACVGGVVLDVVVSGPVWLLVVLALVAVTTIVDLFVIERRRRGGEAG
jgi:Family of unknown function (DUF6343)